MPHTKVLCTVGPSSDNRETLLKMAKNGLSGLRINTAHIETDYVRKIRSLTDYLNSELSAHISILLDLKGPELRVGDLSEPLKIEQGKIYPLSESGIPVNRTGFFSSLKKGDSVVMQDGSYQFSVVEADPIHVMVKALNSGQIRSKARINVPGVKIDLGTLTDRDISFIEEGTKQGVDFYALSFVQSREDMWKLEDQLKASGSDGRTVSKIETKSGYSQIREIAHASDIVMVARGDLGVELPISEVAIAQKRIILEAHRQGIPAIVATQMLESMVQNDVPTRAEVSDVTNAIFDNCDIVMTSEETAIGKYPVEVVRYLNEISAYAEKSATNLNEPDEFFGNQIAYSVCNAAKVMAEKISAQKIVVFTKNGGTARMLSALRPNAEIIAIVSSDSLARKLTMVRGVRVAMLPADIEKSVGVLEAIEKITPRNLFRKGEDIVVASGAPYFLLGGTSDVRVVTIGEFLGRGYPEGKGLKGKAKMAPEEKGEILFTDTEFDHPGKDTRVIVTTKSLTASQKSRLKDSGISCLVLTQIKRMPRKGEMIYLNGSTGVFTSLDSSN